MAKELAVQWHPQKPPDFPLCLLYNKTDLLCLLSVKNHCTSSVFLNMFARFFCIYPIDKNSWSIFTQITTAERIFPENDVDKQKYLSGEQRMPAFGIVPRSLEWAFFIRGIGGCRYYRAAYIFPSSRKSYWGMKEIILSPFLSQPMPKNSTLRWRPRRQPADFYVISSVIDKRQDRVSHTTVGIPAFTFHQTLMRLVVETSGSLHFYTYHRKGECDLHDGFLPFSGRWMLTGQNL